MTKKDWLKLIGFIGLSEAAGIIGTVFTRTAITEWYAPLIKPDLSPPNWLFGPVWIVLYASMGIAAYVVVKRASQNNLAKQAMIAFAVQLVLNTLWTIIFFGLKNPALAFAEIIFLWVSIGITMLLFGRVSRIAAWLLLPYIAWVSFAGYLNFSIWQLNF